MTYDAPKQFSLNEQYTTLDLSLNISNLRATNINVIGIYGKDDGLYSSEQIEKLKKIINVESVYYIENASHNVFIDRQTEFINIIKQKLQ
jgi:proline iminopeptidase